ncbi:MAG: 4'-phosphopantetheinyl transferase superfamily protein [Owenweeksia sp.]|nr:4'-phosphopantetheinyl transferase superfamily protein [Owenweeksia sp.]
MIGNDLVYLPDWGKFSAERKKSFRAKLFTGEEQSSLAKFSNQPDAEALLWSMKEAAYKLYFRVFPVPFYLPKKFECHLYHWCEKEVSGRVAFGKHEFLTQSLFTEDYLHTIALEAAALHGFDEVQKLIKAYHKNQPRLIEDARHSEKLKVEKDENGIPQLLLENKPVPHSVSVSHDGDKIAFAWV